MMTPLPLAFGIKVHLSILPLLIAATGCASFLPDPALETLPDPSHPEDAALMLQSTPDPLEPLNRFSFAVDEVLFDYAMEPASRGYRKALPSRARTGIRNFGHNIAYPVRLTSNLLQGEWANAGTETKRFLINTTEGVLGFGDPATKKYQIYLADEDIGQAFGCWGWQPSMYLHIPIFGASSERDLISEAGDVLLDPTSYVHGLNAGIRFNNKTDQVESTRQLLATEFDPYALNKLYFSRKRAIEVSNAQPAMAGENTAQTQTLMTVFNRPHDPEFDDRAEEITVQPQGFRRPLPASVWKQDSKAPVAYVIPGLGGHRLGSRALALAELAFREGYHVVCFSNNLNWEFIQAAPANYLPGYLNDDLRYLRQAHAAMAESLSEQTQGAPAVMGFSMGGWYTLNLAATSAPDTYSAALAINPPLDLTTGLKALDRLYRAPAAAVDLEAVKDSALVKLLISQNSTPDNAADLPFSDQEASYLIGLSYRMTLTQTIMSSLKIRPSVQAYQRVNALCWEDYYSKIVAPALAERNIDSDALAQASNLRTREPGLTAAANLKLVLTSNDFLLTDDDLAWFRERFPGERTVYSETGGHMGQLWRPEVREAMRAAIRFQTITVSAE